MKKISINTSSIQLDNKIMGKITLEGELTIVHAAEIKDKLEDALQSYQALQVSIQQVTAIDLSCIQLLCGLSKASMALNKDIDFDISLPAETESLISKAGFKSLLKTENMNNQLTVR